MSSIISQNLVIDTIEIRRDAEGRYCLNDLHKAAGGESRHQPSNWLRLEQTEALAGEVEKGIPQIRGILAKQGLGTFVVKELVYGYAMWISPAFHLKVIRTFDEVSTRPQTAPVPLLPAEVGKVTIDCMMEVAAKYGVPASYAMQCAASEATRQTGMPWDNMLTQASIMNNLPVQELYLEPTPLGQLFDLSGVAMNKWLKAEGLQTKVGEVWVATEAGEPYCQRHAWVKAGKSGYNLKWNVAEIERRYYSSDAH